MFDIFYFKNTMEKVQMRLIIVMAVRKINQNLE